MKKELSEQLRTKYQKLYFDQNRDPPRWCAFACGSGWYTLLDVVSDLLTKHSDQIAADQVKEKFGTLRFYHGPVDRYSCGVESAAGQLSGIVCEECGAPGQRRNDGGIIMTRCAEHCSSDCYDDTDAINLERVENFELGKRWSQMMQILLELCDWHTKNNRMPKAALEIRKTNGKLIINVFGGDEFTKGMVDLFVNYTNRVDEHTGLPK